MNPNTYIYVLVRTDIPVADQMVQVGHVCYEAGLKFGAEPDTYLVLCQVDTEEALLEAELRLNHEGIETHKFHEPDDDMGYTALCSQPVSGNLRNKFRRYKLWS